VTWPVPLPATGTSESDVVEALAGLVATSLLNADANTSVRTYRLLETTRAYARANCEARARYEDGYCLGMGRQNPARHAIFQRSDAGSSSPYARCSQLATQEPRNARGFVWGEPVDDQWAIKADVLECPEVDPRSTVARAVRN
jgi:hypothetical protein